MICTTLTALETFLGYLMCIERYVCFWSFWLTGSVWV